MPSVLEALVRVPGVSQAAADKLFSKLKADHAEGTLSDADGPFMAITSDDLQERGYSIQDRLIICRAQQLVTGQGPAGAVQIQ
jgi:hypothetical protein